MDPFEERIHTALRRESAYAPLPTHDWADITHRRPVRRRRRIAAALAAAAMFLLAWTVVSGNPFGTRGGVDPFRIAVPVIVDPERVVHGSGNVVSRDVAVGAFDKLVVTSVFRVTVTRGEVPAVKLRVDDNVVDHVVVESSGGRLHIGIRGRHRFDNTTLTAEVTAGELLGIDASGASQVTMSGDVLAPSVELRAIGASRITGPLETEEARVEASGVSLLGLSGSTGRLVATVTGVSKIELSGLRATAGEVHVSGTSKADVWVTDSLSIDVSGVSSLTYKGKPRIDRQDVSGVASVRSV